MTASIAVKPPSRFEIEINRPPPAELKAVMSDRTPNTFLSSIEDESLRSLPCAGYSPSALVHVTVNPNESIDSALKRFNQKLQQSGLLRELKEHSHYEKPSEKRRRRARRSTSKKY